MTFASLDDFLRRGTDLLAKGPVALLFIEDGTEIASSLAHLRDAGFRQILALTPLGLDLPADLPANIHRIDYATQAEAAVPTAVNAMIAAAPETTWFYYGYNAEYLFHPFCETRNVRELLAFHAEERRDAMLTYVVDLYAADLDRYPDAVSLEHAMLDRSGYYALARNDAQGKALERQLDFFGGLRWRFEEHIPKGRRRIDRIALFRAQPGLTLRDDHTFSIEEYNTYACPWHHNLTAAIVSFRTAKALRTNPGSRFDIPTFAWHNSLPFDWSSRQLMDLGLMEPGQWF
ncbi:MAG: hypothetical protein ACOY5U_11645 [Pseudomonadota bacterium]